MKLSLKIWKNNISKTNSIAEWKSTTRSQRRTKDNEKRKREMKKEKGKGKKKEKTDSQNTLENAYKKRPTHKVGNKLKITKFNSPSYHFDSFLHFLSSLSFFLLLLLSPLP